MSSFAVRGGKLARAISQQASPEFFGYAQDSASMATIEPLICDRYAKRFAQDDGRVAILLFGYGGPEVLKSQRLSS